MFGECPRAGPAGRYPVVPTGRRAPIVDRPIVRRFHEVGITATGTIYTGTNGTVANITTTVAIAIVFWRKRSMVLLLLLLLRGHRRRRRRRKHGIGIGEAIWHLHRRRSIGPRGGRTGRNPDHHVSRCGVQNMPPGVFEVSELRLNLHVHVGWTELWGREKESEREDISNESS